MYSKHLAEKAGNKETDQFQTVVSATKRGYGGRRLKGMDALLHWSGKAPPRR